MKHMLHISTNVIKQNCNEAEGVNQAPLVSGPAADILQFQSKCLISLNEMYSEYFQSSPKNIRRNNSIPVTVPVIQPNLTKERFAITYNPIVLND